MSPTKKQPKSTRRPIPPLAKSRDLSDLAVNLRGLELLLSMQRQLLQDMKRTVARLTRKGTATSRAR